MGLVVGRCAALGPVERRFYEDAGLDAVAGPAVPRQLQQDGERPSEHLDLLYALLQHPAQQVEWLREVEPGAVVDVPSADPSDYESAGPRGLTDGDGAADVRRLTVVSRQCGEDAVKVKP